jgi:hypothetical protein
MRVPKRTVEQKLECIRKVISNSKEHIESGDPKRVYSQYIRYALDEIKNLNFYTSKKAKGLKREDIIHEHVVPHSIVMNKLLSLKPLCNENIMEVLNKFYVLCAITKEEDKLLNAAGYRSKMPDGWNEDTDSIFARYEEVGISIFNDTI